MEYEQNMRGEGGSVSWKGTLEHFDKAVFSI